MNGALQTLTLKRRVVLFASKNFDPLLFLSFFRAIVSRGKVNSLLLLLRFNMYNQSIPRLLAYRS
jgi:hypothetical protein